MESKEIKLVSEEEQGLITRKLLSAIGLLAAEIPIRLNYEYLESNGPSMALSIIQGAYKVPGGEYIDGGYKAQVQFKVIYRAQPKTNDGRLDMDEVLNQLGAKLTTSEIDLGYGILFGKIQFDSRSSLFDRYENGDEDHQILMTMTYEVI